MARPKRTKQPQNIVGQRFGKLIVLGHSGTVVYGGVHRRHQWLCKCDCGEEKVITGASLRSGLTVSCGCHGARVAGQNNRTHGLSKTKEHRTWCHIKDRCHNPQCKRYADYGGRGIVVCDKWRYSFSSFLADVGMAPSQEHEIDRIDNHGNYEPGNCRWATLKEQARNTRRNHLLLYEGRSQSIAAWAEEFGMSTDCLKRRIYNGWPIHDALTRPVGRWSHL